MSTSVALLALLAGLTGLVGAGAYVVLVRRRDRRLIDAQAELMEQKLAHAQDQLLLVQGILETIDAAVFCFDADGELVLINERAHEVARRGQLGQDTDPDLDLLWHEDRVTRVGSEDRITARARRGEDVDGVTFWIGPPDDQIALLASARQVRKPSGERYAAVVAAWEVTEILEAVRVREEFLTTVSHELRTPLTSIMGYHELIEEGLDPDQDGLRRMLGVAQRNAHVLLSRVSQLLQASDREEMAIRPREVDLSLLLRDAVRKHYLAAETSRVRIRSLITPGICAHVDPDAWEQVVDNFVSNAVKYTPSGGEVVVTLRPTGGDFDLGVADTGIGMSSSERQRVFDRFYRSHAARTHAIPGLGVGLSIAKELVEAHGGEVRLESTPGAGTTVSVRAPLRVEVQARA